MNHKETIAYAERRGFKPARKVAPVYAVSIAAGNLRVQTREGLESLTVSEPVAVCRGIHNRDLWVQKASKLEKAYNFEREAESDERGESIAIEYVLDGQAVVQTRARKHVPKPITRLVCEVLEDFEVKTSWSPEPLKGKAGDFVVKAGEDDYYPLGKKEFDETYAFE